MSHFLDRWGSAYKNLKKAIFLQKKRNKGDFSFFFNDYHSGLKKRMHRISFYYHKKEKRSLF